MANPTEQVEIADFSAGIFSDNHAVNLGSTTFTGNTTNGFIRLGNGAAVLEDTYRCCADPSGALTPLPRALAGRVYSVPTPVTTGYWPTGGIQYQLLDACVMGPTVDDGFSWSDAASQGNLSSEDNYLVNVLYGFYYASDGAGLSTGYTYYALGHQYQVIKGVVTGQRDFFFDSTGATRWAASTFPRDYPAGGLVPLRATSSATISIGNIYVGLAGVISGYWNRGSATAISANDAPLTDADTYLGGFYTTSPYGAKTGGVHIQYPDPGTPTSSSIWVNSSATKPLKPVMVIAHQDRYVIAERDSVLFSTDGAVMRDAFTYGAPNDPKALATTSRPFRTEFGSENVSGVGVMASVSSDRLLIIKNHGGGYLVLGDLNNPTLHKLPFVESTYNISSYPAMTPMGCVYGSRNGVFVWAGGETSEKLSNQLEGHFWDCRVTGGPKYEGSNGRFAWWHPWVMVPNNFMYDSRTKSWWRLDQVTNMMPSGFAEDTTGLYNAPYFAYQVNPANGRLHAFPRMINQSQTSVDYVFDPEVLASTYSWKSQPLVETRARLRAFQDLTLVASGRGNQNVRVTLTGFNTDGTELTPVIETFTFTGSAKARPVVLRHNLHQQFVAMDVQVRIEVFCEDFPFVPAAKVHSLSIGTSDRQLHRTT
jgi:hypothetical protein